LFDSPFRDDGTEAGVANDRLTTQIDRLQAEVTQLRQENESLRQAEAKSR
jgi:hypothetical protein